MRYCGLYNKYMYRIALMAAFVLAIATSCEQQANKYNADNNGYPVIFVNLSLFHSVSHHTLIYDVIGSIAGFFFVL